MSSEWCGLGGSVSLVGSDFQSDYFSLFRVDARAAASAAVTGAN